MIKIEDYTIKQYARMLKEQKPTDKILLKEIDAELTKLLSNLGNGQDIYLFQLQKDLLLLECKLALAILSMDKKKEEKLTKRVAELRKEVADKTKKVEIISPYKSFLNWILSLEKYFNKDFDWNRDLLYLVQATTQMLTNYESQKQNINEQNAKRK